MESGSMILPWQEANVMVSLVDLWIAWLPSRRVAPTLYLPGVELLPSNQLQTTHIGLSNFNNQNIGSSAVIIDRDLGLIRDSFYCFKIAHWHWRNVKIPRCNYHQLFAPSNFYISKLDKAWRRASYLYWSPANPGRRRDVLHPVSSTQEFSQ